MANLTCPKCESTETEHEDAFPREQAGNPNAIQEFECLDCGHTWIPVTESAFPDAKALFKKHGFEAESTGGGCMAYHLDIPHARYLWVTDEHAGLPNAGDTVYIGVYLASEAPDSYQGGLTLAWHEFVPLLESGALVRVLQHLERPHC